MAEMCDSMSEFDAGTGDLFGVLGARFGEITYPAGTATTPQALREVLFVITQRGAMRAELVDMTFQAGEGEVALFLPGDVSRLRFDDAQLTRQSWFAGELRGLTPAMRERLWKLPRRKAASSAITYLVREALTCELTHLTADGALLDALATAILLRYLAEVEADPKRFPRSLELARLHIHRNVEQRLTLGDIAEAAGVTPPHLIRLFRAHLGTTPMEYLWSRRVTLGIELLSSTDLSVGAVAAHCGFSTSFHFSRRIREATGVSPTQLRKGLTRTGPMPEGPG
ncbi:helix-turn-helix transcriptional regulator [Streptomyces sp. B6B3]|uniref:helix-turn-helix transcriptional regulator n=1 Tax=Streptomyces sp. B6B3 TaxID=3153570 RepID=UPI00325E028C